MYLTMDIKNTQSKTGKTDKPTIMVRNLKITLPVIDGMSKQNISGMQKG